MLAMQFTEPDDVENKPLKEIELPIPEPKEGQVRIKIEVCGVCHTDLHIIEGDISPSKIPIIPGHQVVGRIDKVGCGVPEVITGTRVGIPWLYDTCGVCEFCQSGRENLCSKARFTGFNVNGGFSEYMVAEYKYVLPLPSSISDQQAAPLLCAGIIGYRSLKQADVSL